MSITVNGESQVPPGFRFHPTEEELLQYYLKKKVASHKIDLDVIQDVDLNKLEPWDIQDKCKIGSSTPQSDWYFFSHKDKKYPTGTRTNRATASGFWKATGRDKAIYGGPNSSSSRRIGMRKTLVFYKGRAPHGQKSDWIMHEYRLDDNPNTTTTITTNAAEMSNNIEEGWVVCRVFMKKNQHKALLSGDHHHQTSSINNDPHMMITPTNYNYNYNWAHDMIDSCNHNDDDVIDQDQGTLEQIMQLGGCKEQYDEDKRRSFLKLPSLHQHDEIHTMISLNNSSSISSTTCTDADHDHDQSSGIQDWAALDRLVASHLNGQQPCNNNYYYNNNNSSKKQLVLNNNGDDDQVIMAVHHRLPSPSSSSSSLLIFQNNEYSCDLWSIARSSTNHHQLCNKVPEESGSYF